MSAFGSHVIQYTVDISTGKAKQQLSEVMDYASKVGSKASGAASAIADGSTKAINVAAGIGQSALGAVGDPSIAGLTSVIQGLTSSLTSMFGSSASTAGNVAASGNVKPMSVAQMTINANVVNLAGGGSGGMLRGLGNKSPLESKASGEIPMAELAPTGPGMGPFVAGIGVAAVAIGSLTAAAIAAAESLAPFNGDLFDAVTGFEMVMTGLKMQLADDLGPALAETIGSVEKALAQWEPNIASLANSVLDILNPLIGLFGELADVVSPIIGQFRVITALLGDLIGVAADGFKIMKDIAMVQFNASPEAMANLIKDATASMNKSFSDMFARTGKAIEDYLNPKKAKSVDDLESMGNKLFMGLFNALETFGKPYIASTAEMSNKGHIYSNFGMQGGPHGFITPEVGLPKNIQGVASSSDRGRLHSAAVASAAEAAARAGDDALLMARATAKNAAKQQSILDAVNSALASTVNLRNTPIVTQATTQPATTQPTASSITNASTKTAMESRTDAKEATDKKAIPRATAAAVNLHLTDKVEFQMQEGLHEQATIDFARYMIQQARNVFDDRSHKIWTSQMLVNQMLTRGVKA